VGAEPTVNLVQEALSWLDRGIAVFPVKRDKTPALANWKWLQSSLPSESQVRRWLCGAPGYAVVTGWQGLVALDFDRGDLYRGWFQWARARGGIAQLVAEHSLTVETRRGRHVYLFSETSEPVHMRGLDVQSAGRYVLGPGSLHPSGLRYEALDADAPIVRVSTVLDVLPPFVRRVSPVDTRPDIAVPTKPIEHERRPSINTGAALAWDERILAAKRVPVWEVLGLDVQSARATSAHHIMCSCPAHSDTHPSMSVDTSTNRVSCLCGCTGNKGWDSIDAARWRYGVGFQRAVWLLTERM